MVGATSLVFDLAEGAGEPRDRKTVVVPRKKEGCGDHVTAHAAEHVDQLAELGYVLLHMQRLGRMGAGITSCSWTVPGCARFGAR